MYQLEILYFLAKSEPARMTNKGDMAVLVGAILYLNKLVFTIIFLKNENLPPPRRFCCDQYFLIIPKRVVQDLSQKLLVKRRLGGYACLGVQKKIFLKFMENSRSSKNMFVILFIST